MTLIEYITKLMVTCFTWKTWNIRNRNLTYWILTRSIKYQLGFEH